MFEISFVGSVDDGRGRDVVLTDAFRVQGEDSEVLVTAVLSRQAAAILGDADHAADLVRVAAIEEIEQRLRAGTLPPDDGSTTVEIVYDSSQVPALQAVGQREKECLWQVREPRNWQCRATSDFAHSEASRAMCANCDIPDARILWPIWSIPRSRSCRRSVPLGCAKASAPSATSATTQATAPAAASPGACPAGAATSTRQRRG